MKLFKSKKAVAVAASAALVLGIAGGAFAFWTTNGSGTGDATSSSASSVAISATIGNFTGLGTTKTFNTTLTNNNSGSVDVSGETLSLTSVDCSGGVAPAVVGVPGTWFDLGGNVTAPAGLIAGGGGTATITGTTLTLNNSTTDNQDACQGATITAHFSLS